MEYIYYLGNTSLTLRVVEYLLSASQLPLHFITVIHRINGWVIRIRMHYFLDPQQDGDFRAFMSELGVAYEPEKIVQMALWSLANGKSAVEVMQEYQVAVVTHGYPDREEIEDFREHFVSGLGYCPETLA
jgi:hypothetical protein